MKRNGRVGLSQENNPPNRSRRIAKSDGGGLDLAIQTEPADDFIFWKSLEDWGGGTYHSSTPLSLPV
ncbi:hypothetical protein HYR99_20935 [Candidatus Poribacteria bacterium]|nr:hypothetical protein [Candidatus Poribacteria bacterium]